MTGKFERDVRTARSRAAEAIRRAEASAARAERFARLAREGSPVLRELHNRLARAERVTEERHRASARIQEAWAVRLERSARPGRHPVEAPMLASAVADALGVGSMGITLWTGDGAVAALIGTDERARSAQDLEIVLGSGPAYATATSREAVRAPDEVLRSRWPEYAAHAAGLGIRAVTAVPLSLGPSSAGSLSVFDDGFAERAIDLTPLQTVADALIDGIRSELETDPWAHRSSLLAGDRAYLLHNAAGRVSVEERCDTASALAMIRARAFSSGTSAVEVARRILEEGLRLGEEPEGV